MRPETAVIGYLSIPRRQERLRVLLGMARRKPLGTVGLLLLLLAIGVAIFAPVTAPYDPSAPQKAGRLVPPNSIYWFGTDHLARDILSRTMYGARISLSVGLGVVLAGATAGTAIAIVSVYLGGRFDLVVQRFVDAIAAFPALVLALVLVSLMGRSLISVIIALAIVSIPVMVRTVRSAALSVKESQYVEAARAIGAGHLRIMLRYLVPNCMAPMIIVSTAQLGSAMVTEATLSFLGLGTPITTPSWGGMLGGAVHKFGVLAPWIAIFPGLALSIAVFGINLFGDALRDVLDPRLRQR